MQKTNQYQSVTSISNFRKKTDMNDWILIIVMDYNEEFKNAHHQYQSFSFSSSKLFNGKKSTKLGV